jgi:hypothetical protein
MGASVGMKRRIKLRLHNTAMREVTSGNCPFGVIHSDNGVNGRVR